MFHDVNSPQTITESQFTLFNVILFLFHVPVLEKSSNTFDWFDDGLNQTSVSILNIVNNIS